MTRPAEEPSRQPRGEALARSLYQHALDSLTNNASDRTLELCRAALPETKDHPGLRNNLALVLKRLECLLESESALRELTTDYPDDSDAWNNLGEVLKAQGRVEEAIPCLRQALRCTNSNRQIHDNLLLALQYVPTSSRESLAAEHRCYGDLLPSIATPKHNNLAEPNRVLRIGYLSADFRQHAAARFIEPLLRGRNRDHFEIILYGQVQELDQTSQRLISLVDGWRRTSDSSSQALAAQIQQDRIDILVDLAGHTAGNRLDVLPLRPAPLQLTTLGYPDTTGLMCLDGRISDAVLDPAGEEQFSSEPLLRLEGSFACFQPPAAAPALSDPPCLPGAPVRLLAPHQLFKLGDPLLQLWARVLEQLPNAELVVLRSSLTPANQAALAARMSQCGIDPARVRMERPLRDDHSYLEAIARCDLMLDASPHNGHTTSCEALWMGLPVITRLGERPCGRLTASVLTAMGRNDWIATTDQSYIETVVRVANDRCSLKSIRYSLRTEMTATVSNTTAYVARLEALYRQLWQQWCSKNTRKQTLRGEPGSQAMPPKTTSIHIVAATRLDAQAFRTDTLLGRCLQDKPHQELLPLIAYNNCAPLAQIYNAAIDTAPPDAILVFCHDDVDLGLDPLLPQLEKALENFDLVGVAGNQRRQPGQMAWWLEGSTQRWDHAYLSGKIRHGHPNDYEQTRFGPAPRAVELLDGVFLAARAGALQENDVRFDPRFAFHFYDLDVCRSARECNLKLGTWPLQLTHGSAGKPYSPSWLEALNLYQHKWSEPRHSPAIDHFVQQRSRIPTNHRPSLNMLQSANELHSENLPQLLESLDFSLVVTTYQAGQAITIGHHRQALSFGFCSFRQAMGVARTPNGLALASKHEIWSLIGQRDLASQVKPEGTHDIALLTRSCHITGPVMAHELAWCNGRVVFVNTLCNCLAAIEAPWSFVPIWHPPFITGTAPGDRCHLNGLAISEDGTPAYVTMHGISDVENGWREHKANGGVLMEVSTGRVLCQGLSMPHSPRLHRGELYVLNSGQGQLLRVDRNSGNSVVVAELPGFTRGLDLIGNTAVVGLSRIRESSVFGGLPLQQQHEHLRCGVALVDLSTGELQGFCWFEDGVEEVFGISVLPGFRNPKLIGPKARADENDDDSQTIWLIPPQRSSAETIQQ